MHSLLWSLPKKSNGQILKGLREWHKFWSILYIFFLSSCSSNSITMCVHRLKSSITTCMLSFYLSLLFHPTYREHNLNTLLSALRYTSYHYGPWFVYDLRLVLYMLNLENLFFKCQQCYLSYSEKKNTWPFLKKKKKTSEFLNPKYPYIKC